MVEGVGTTTWTYDAVGNRLTQDTHLASNVYTYDVANPVSLRSRDERPADERRWAGLLVGCQPPSASLLGAGGNLLDDGTRTYAYDHARAASPKRSGGGNRLSSVVQGPNKNMFGYRCNGLSRDQWGIIGCGSDRVSRTVNGVTTNYVLEQAAGLTQVLSDGTDDYLYGGDRIAQVNGSETGYFLPDGLGSVRQLTDASGIVILAKNYDPFGSVVANAGTVITPYGFTGERQDNSTGLLYLRARYYSIDVGRFLTRDTWQGISTRPSTLNDWNYVEGNPINLTDPSGHWVSLPTDCVWGTAKECVDEFRIFYSKEGPIRLAGQMWGGRFDCSNTDWSTPQTTLELAADYICERGPDPVPFIGSDRLTKELAKSILIHERREEFYIYGDMLDFREEKFNYTREFFIAWLDLYTSGKNGAIPEFPISQFVGSFDYRIHRLPSGRVKFEIKNQTDMASGSHLPFRFPPDESRNNPLSMEQVIDENKSLESMNSMQMIQFYRDKDNLAIVSILRPKLRTQTGGTGSGVLRQTYTWTEQDLCGVTRSWPAYLSYLDIN